MLAHMGRSPLKALDRVAYKPFPFSGIAWRALSAVVPFSLAARTGPAVTSRARDQGLQGENYIPDALVCTSFPELLARPASALALVY
jgi:hypothetical protein